MTHEEAVEEVLQSAYEKCNQCENGVNVKLDEDHGDIHIEVCRRCRGVGILVREAYAVARSILGLPPIYSPQG